MIQPTHSCDKCGREVVVPDEAKITVQSIDLCQSEEGNTCTYTPITEDESE